MTGKIIMKIVMPENANDPSGVAELYSQNREVEMKMQLGENFLNGFMTGKSVAYIWAFIHSDAQVDFLEEAPAQDW